MKYSKQNSSIRHGAVEKSGDDSFIKKLHSTTEEVKERLSRLRNKHDKVNESIRAIRSQGVRLFNGSKMSHVSKTKMVALYNSALKQCETEHNTLENLLADIHKVRNLRFRQKMTDKLSRGSLMLALAQHAHSLPLYIGSIDGHPPALVGAISQEENLQSIDVGDLAAAYVEDVWILAEIKNQLSSTKYEINDIDDETERQIILHIDKLIPLPHYRADPRRHGHALFPKNAIVLALYPQTTCFYKGVVELVPVGPNDDYLIAFEDNSFPSGYSPTLPVPQMYVLTYRDVSAPPPQKRRALVSDDEE